jgi:hypothetical protein
MSTKVFFFALALLFVFTAGNAQSAKSKSKMSSTSGSQSSMAFFNGAWKSEDGKGFSVMHDGYFNAVGQDSSGKWGDVHAGTYKINGDNTISFTVLYSSWPDHIGSVNTADYTISGETIKLHHFKKLVDANGKDMTDQMPKDAWETMTRVQ